MRGEALHSARTVGLASPDWLDEGSAFAEDRFEDEGDGISDYLGEPKEVFDDD
jgi:hypothetical protein